MGFKYSVLGSGSFECLALYLVSLSWTDLLEPALLSDYLTLPFLYDLFDRDRGLPVAAIPGIFGKLIVTNPPFWNLFMVSITFNSFEPSTDV